MPIKPARLFCSGCGAPLVAGDFDLSVICSYCKSRQEFVSDPTKASELELLDWRNRRLKVEAREFRLREELRRIDRAWARFSKRLAESSREDGVDSMTDLGSYVLALVTVVICTFLCAGYGEQGFVVSLIVAGAACLAISLRNEKRRATEYENYRSRYEIKRSDLLEETREVSALRSTLE